MIEKHNTAVFFIFLLRNGSVEVDLKVFTVINANTTKQVKAVDHLMDGIVSALKKEFKVTSIIVLGMLWNHYISYQYIHVLIHGIVNKRKWSWKQNKKLEDWKKKLSYQCLVGTQRCSSTPHGWKPHAGPPPNSSTPAPHSFPRQVVLCLPTLLLPMGSNVNALIGSSLGCIIET